MPVESNLYKYAKPVMIGGIILILANSAFSSETRKSIRTRSAGKSEISGVEGLIEASHLNHSRGYLLYDDPVNGISMLLIEHLLYHLSFSEFPHIIGLNKKDNNCAIMGLEKRIYIEKVKSISPFDEIKRVTLEELYDHFYLLTQSISDITKERELNNPYIELKSMLDQEAEFDLIQYLVSLAQSQDNLRIF